MEGHILKISGGALACVLRENNHNGYPSYCAFSYDGGRSWTKPKPLPFAGDRPFAEEMPDGRNTGTHAWLGDLSEGHQPSGVHYGDEVALDADALHIRNRPNATTRYQLMPPETFRTFSRFGRAWKARPTLRWPCSRWDDLALPSRFCATRSGATSAEAR